MVRAFLPDPIPEDVLGRVFDAATRAPSAGNAQGSEFVALVGAEQTATYWDVTLPAGVARDRFGYPKLLDAPVLLLPLADSGAYLRRYSEADKAGSGLGESADRWPAPYWTIDTAFAAMLVLLAAVDEGLGALFFGIFDHERELLDALHVPDGMRPIGTIALGWPDDDADRARLGRSASRRRRGIDDVVHWGTF